MSNQKQWTGRNIHRNSVVTRSVSEDGSFSIVNMKHSAPQEPEENNPYLALFKMSQNEQQRKVRSQVRDEQLRTKQKINTAEIDIEDQLDLNRNMLKEWGSLNKKRNEMYHNIIYQDRVKRFRKKWSQKSQQNLQERSSKLGSIKESDQYFENNEGFQESQKQKEKSFYAYFDQVITRKNKNHNKNFFPEICLGVANNLYENRGRQRSLYRPVSEIDIKEGGQLLQQRPSELSHKHSQSQRIIRARHGNFGGTRSSPKHSLTALGGLNIVAKSRALGKEYNPYEPNPHYKIK